MIAKEEVSLLGLDKLQVMKYIPIALDPSKSLHCSYTTGTD